MNKVILDKIDNWPNSWKICNQDIAYGNKLVKLMKPFIIELLETYTSRTVKKHIDNLWLLGGFTIDRINRNEKYRNTEPCLLLPAFIDSIDGPLIHDLSEEEQKSFDSTCRKFYKHLVENILIKLVS